MSTSTSITLAALPDALSPLHWFARLRATRGYDVAMAVLASVWFFVLALAVGLAVITQARAVSTTDFGRNGWPALLVNICAFLFYVAMWWLTLARPPPTKRSVGVLPSLVAFAGSYLPWTVVLFTPAAASDGQNLASAALLLIGSVLMVVVICHLGRSFSIVPQARRLVRTGPYAVIRHPLYLVEEIALLGTLVRLYSPVVLALFLVHGALQVCRMLYEDNLLADTFPDYGDYAKSTSRLIPHIW